MATDMSEASRLFTHPVFILIVLAIALLLFVVFLFRRCIGRMDRGPQ